VSDSFEPFELVEYARQRWRAPVVVIGCALAAALVLSLILPKEYTATASMIIEPPAGSDARISTAVSPVYLESLKTYEQFASSDSLFARACDKFHLLSGPDAPSIESFKRKVLRVTKPKETKVLQITATLSDPKQAQRLVQYLAEETANLNQSVARGSENEMLDRARKQATQATTELQQARAGLAAAAASGAESLLQAQVTELSKLESDIRSQLVDANSLIAEYTARESALANTTPSPAELSMVRQEVAAQRAKAASLAASRDAVARDLGAKSAALVQTKVRQDQADEQFRIAQNSYDAAAKRLLEVDAAAGTRAEQLRIIDSGIVPQRPSFPNLPLNCAAAVLIGLVTSAGYLVMRFGLERQRARFARASFRVARGGGD
jgi:capsular polysaccharide biosynthesis protein